MPEEEVQDPLVEPTAAVGVEETPAV